jgi:hypothetical protein
VNTTTPAVPLLSATANIAAALPTSGGSVLMLKNTGGLAIGPGFGPTCQPTTLMPCATACSMASACEAASTPPSTMPSGFSAIACEMPESSPSMVPRPSMARNFQPMTPAASSTPSPAARTPLLRWSVET